MNEIKQLAEIYTMVERGEMSPIDFFLGFRSRFENEITNARDGWREKHSDWKSWDWSKIENNPFLSELLGKKRCRPNKI